MEFLFCEAAFWTRSSSGGVCNGSNDGWFMDKFDTPFFDFIIGVIYGVNEGRSLWSCNLYMLIRSLILFEQYRLHY